jgi:hypothetical protein
MAMVVLLMSFKDMMDELLRRTESGRIFLRQCTNPHDVTKAALTGEDVIVKLKNGKETRIKFVKGE